MNKEDRLRCITKKKAYKIIVEILDINYRSGEIDKLIETQFKDEKDRESMKTVIDALIYKFDKLSI